MITELTQRSAGKCELCEAENATVMHIVSPKTGSSADECVLLCHTCDSGIQNTDSVDVNHWRCLAGSMWSEVPAVKVLTKRLLQSIKTDWAEELLSSMWMEDELEEWAALSGGTAAQHKDSNGNILNEGDSVVLIKDLDVKGGGFTAKRGTAVRNIRLVPDNAGQIEGRVEGQKIVILTQYVKKQ